MSSGYRRQFFDGVKDHSEIKLRAFRRYLRPWAQKVGSQRGVTRVWVVDGFAGPGTYRSGELGSAGIAMSEARYANSLGRGYKMSCFFAEKDKANFSRLKRLQTEFRDVEVIPSPKDFWGEVDNVVSMVGRDPVFLFVDPFGLGDLKFEPLTDLCNRLRQVDLMVNLASPAAKRLEPKNADLVSAAVGGPGWTPENLTEVFCQRLSDKCRFLPPAPLPVEGTFGGLKYEVILAARHRAAYELWNDEIARDDRDVLTSGDAKDIERRIEDAKMILRREVAERRNFRRDDLLSDVETSFCGEVHRSIYLRAVKSLVESGEWSKDAGPVGTSWMHTSR